MSKRWYPLCIGATQVALFVKNPLDWYAVALEGGESVPNQYMYRGLLAHQEIACLLGGQRHPVEGREYLTEAEAAAAESVSRKFVDVFAGEAHRFQPMQAEEGRPIVEWTFSPYLENLPAPFEGTLDFYGLVDGTPAIVDWKTTGQRTDRWLSANRDFTQRYAYGMWYYNVIDSQAETIPFYYALVGQDGEDGEYGVRLIDASVSTSEMLAWYENILVPVAWAMKGMWHKT